MTESSDLSQSTSRTGNNDYWGWDTESSAVVLRRKTSSEILEDALTDKINSALHVTPGPAPSSPVPVSRYSMLRFKRHQSTAQSPCTHIVTAPLISGSPLAQSSNSPGLQHYPPPSPSPDCESSFGDSTIDDSSCTFEEDSDYFQSANTSANTSVGTIDTPVLLGLGIIGLAKQDGTPFDGTGVVGLSSGAHRNQRAFDKDSEEAGDDSAEYTGPRQVSRTFIDEVSHTFSSLPLRHRALQRVFPARDPARSVSAVRTPTPYPRDFMEATGGEYFPTQNVGLGASVARK